MYLGIVQYCGTRKRGIHYWNGSPKDKCSREKNINPSRRSQTSTRAPCLSCAVCAEERGSEVSGTAPQGPC